SRALLRQPDGVRVGGRTRPARGDFPGGDADPGAGLGAHLPLPAADRGVLPGERAAAGPPPDRVRAPADVCLRGGPPGAEPLGRELAVCRRRVRREPRVLCGGGAGLQPHVRPFAQDRAVCPERRLIARPQAPRSRGFRRSWSPSPRKLNPSTTERIARPGNVATHQYSNLVWPAAIIAPHSGAGGMAPNPMNERAAVRMIAFPISRVPFTTTGGKAFGSTCRRSPRQAGAPRARAAST